MADPIDLDHIDRLFAAATPGPWEVDGGLVGVCDCDAREEGRAEERAAIVAWLLDEGEAFLSEDIERGKHREEDDNA